MNLRILLSYIRIDFVVTDDYIACLISQHIKNGGVAPGQLHRFWVSLQKHLFSLRYFKLIIINSVSKKVIFIVI